MSQNLEEGDDTRFPKSQWKSIRTSNAIERLHEEFKGRIEVARFV
jgi:putative transposase